MPSDFHSWSLAQWAECLKSALKEWLYGWIEKKNKTKHKVSNSIFNTNKWWALFQKIIVFNKCEDKSQRAKFMSQTELRIFLYTCQHTNIFFSLLKVCSGQINESCQSKYNQQRRGAWGWKAEQAEWKMIPPPQYFRDKPWLQQAT